MSLRNPVNSYVLQHLHVYVLFLLLLALKIRIEYFLLQEL